MIETVEKLAETAGLSVACQAMGVARSNVYRARQPKKEAAPRPTPERALSTEEKVEVRTVLNSERFWDSSPRQVYATLLDEGKYYCHWRTMYRIQKEYGEVRERRNQCRRPRSNKPVLRATGPNQLWSWDVSYLKGSLGIHYYLYVVIDVFSRYVVGWMIANRESAELAEELISKTCAKQNIERDKLTLHSDRGSAMRSKTVAQLLIDLGVAKSHSRPYTPTDNPYSEAQFRTMKYHPEYPKSFESIQDARKWARAFFHWYNHKHHHSGLALMTPATVHHSQVEAVYEKRQQVLDAAFAAHPERFVRGQPTPARPAKEVWINRPTSDHQTNDLADSAAGDEMPGAQAESRGALRSLDSGEHLATIEPSLNQSKSNGVSFPKFEQQLSHNA